MAAGSDDVITVGTSTTVSPVAAVAVDDVEAVAVLVAAAVLDVVSDAVGSAVGDHDGDGVVVGNGVDDGDADGDADEDAEADDELLRVAVRVDVADACAVCDDVTAAVPLDVARGVCELERVDV